MVVMIKQQTNANEKLVVKKILKSLKGNRQALVKPKQEMLWRNIIFRIQKKPCWGQIKHPSNPHSLQSAFIFNTENNFVSSADAAITSLFTSSFRSLLNTENTMGKKESIILTNGWRQNMKKHIFKLGQKKKRDLSNQKNLIFRD